MYNKVLLDMGRDYIDRIVPNIGNGERDVLKQLLDDFIKLPTTDNLKVKRQKFLIMASTTEPIDKINDIINITYEPLPSSKYRSQFSNRKSLRPWTSLEDKRLIAGIYHYGIDDWKNVATFIGNNRTKQQAQQRWERCLDPHISHDKWTKEENEELLKNVEKYGKKCWKTVASKMGRRTDVQCRYQYKQIMKLGLMTKDDTEDHSKEKEILQTIETPEKEKKDMICAPPLVLCFPLPLEQFLKHF